MMSLTEESIYIMGAVIADGRFQGDAGEAIVVWPETDNEFTLIQRWLPNGARLDLLHQIYNWRLALSPNDDLFYEDDY